MNKGFRSFATNYAETLRPDDRRLEFEEQQKGMAQTMGGGGNGGQNNQLITQGLTGNPQRLLVQGLWHQ